MKTNNKLIAEFLGYKLEEKNYQYQNFHSSNESSWEWDKGVIVTLDGEEVSNFENEPMFSFDELNFEGDWNLLIDALKKIEQLMEGIPNQLLNISLYSEINEVYDVIVEFIKWYNNENR